MTKSSYVKLWANIQKKMGSPDLTAHIFRHPYVKHKTKSFLRNSREFLRPIFAPHHIPSVQKSFIFQTIST